MVEWFKCNKWSLNIKKTNYMVFNKNLHKEFALNMDECLLTEVSDVKFLGVCIENKLTWKKQIQCVVSKVSKGLAILKQLRKYFDNDTLYMVYCTLISPYLDYCSEIWGNTFNSHIQKLVVLQKKALRIVDGLNYRDHTHDTFKKYNCLKFKDHVKFKTCLHVFKAVNNDLPFNLQEKYVKVKNVHKYNTRSSNNLYKKQCKTESKSKNISIYGVDLFNTLPVHIKEASSIKKFKVKLKEYLINNSNE